MTTSDQERAVIEAAKALVERLKDCGEWYSDQEYLPTCIICGTHTNSIHDEGCELAALMNAVDEMNNNPPLE